MVKLGGCFGLFAELLGRPSKGLLKNGPFKKVAVMWRTNLEELSSELMASQISSPVSSLSFTPVAGVVGSAVPVSLLEDSFFDILEPDILAPDGRESAEAKAYNGERRLMAAILVDGVEAYLRYHLEGAIVDPEVSAEEIVSWVEDDSADYVFGFDTVCNALGINPRYLRTGLHRFVKAVNQRRADAANHDTASGGPAPRVFSGWKKIRRPRKRE